MSWRSPHQRPLPNWQAAPLLMGILNVTPDSFSDGGLACSVEAAADRAEQLVAEGADLLDLGAESTRPGATPVDATTELGRLLPVIAAVRRRLPAVPLSIDTYKASVARACIAAGADLINDVEGGAFEADQKGSPMARTCAELGCPLILMHRRKEANYQDFWPEILGETRGMIQRARDAGIAPEQLWVDPGFGFGKTPAQNLQIVRDLAKFAALGYPVLLGTSRKSTLGLVLGQEDPLKRHEATAATCVWGLAQGAAMVRVHDVARLKPYLAVAKALRQGAGWAA
ncbi:dihydropteroate synthase [bacterium]|nr:dihydropteroate synthase [bacterium]